MEKTVRLLAILTIMAMLFPQAPSAAPTNTMYVATNACGTGDGTNWANATSNLQWAIDNINPSTSYPTNTVWVSNGVYNVGCRSYQDATSNRVVISKVIAVRSANNDPANTVIMGAKDTVGGAPTNGPAAVRCVWMIANSSLIGFQLTNGATATGSGDTPRGGGVYCYNGSLTPIISNCVISGNSAATYAGGVYAGTLYNCIINNNSALNGGGSMNSIMHNCTLVTNWTGAGGIGGGAYNSGTLNNCALIGNSSQGGGGGAMGVTLNNCLVISNSTTAAYGGGVYNCNMSNCTVVANSAASAGGGMYVNHASVIIWNSIIYHNINGNLAIVSSDSVVSFTNSCTYPTPSGAGTINWAGSITNDPSFVNTNAGNYRLSQSSPCINAGLNQTWMNGAVDLDGHSRIDRFSGIVDMGCYEYLPAGTMYQMGIRP
jgi:hypothetical protein